MALGDGVASCTPARGWVLCLRYGARRASQLIPPSSLKNHLLRLSGVVIGEGVFIGDGVRIIDGFRRGVVIRDFAVVSPGVTLISMAFPSRHSTPRVLAYVRCGPVQIGAYSWIGANSVILPGVSVGDETVLGAGSVLTRSTGSQETWLGSPARRRDPD